MNFEMGTENWKLGPVEWELRTENWKLRTVGGGGALKGLQTDQVIIGEMRGLKFNCIGREGEGGQSLSKGGIN